MKGVVFRLTFFGALFLSASCGVQAQSSEGNPTKSAEYAMKLRESVLFKISPKDVNSSVTTLGSYPWHENIVTTVFWVGEDASGNNPVPNRSSAWDSNWAQNYGGNDVSVASGRSGFIPVRFIPHQNPFYIALPYNDVSSGKTKPDASRIVPWFRRDFVKSGQSVLKDHWVAIRKGNRICYAQWEDVGPFLSDHGDYVFGNSRPRTNLNRGAGLDVSPAVRDYLRLSSTDVTSWKFVEIQEIPPGPWTIYGNNNTFVLNRQKRQEAVAKSGARRKLD
jgi:hypothetical protein